MGLAPAATLRNPSLTIACTFKNTRSPKGLTVDVRKAKVARQKSSSLLETKIKS